MSSRLHWGLDSILPRRINVLINQWNNAFYDAVQERNWDVFIWQLEYFTMLATCWVIFKVYQTYLQQWLLIRWRQWMTVQYLERWISNANHYRMQLLGDAADNPDQRIAEDIKSFIDLTLYICIGVLSSVVSFFSFVLILWGLSAEAPLILFGVNVAIPGYLVWIALVYSIAGTAVTHLIGRALIAPSPKSLYFPDQRRPSLETFPWLSQDSM